jgi:hypothetical protein
MMPRIIDFGGAKFSKNHADQDEVADDMESIENISKLLQSYGIDPIKTQQSLKERRNKL